MRHNCNIAFNNETYCGMNPIEKGIDFLTTSNYGLLPNWVILLGGISIIFLWCFILYKIGYFNDANSKLDEVEE